MSSLARDSKKIGKKPVLNSFYHAEQQVTNCIKYYILYYEVSFC